MPVLRSWWGRHRHPSSEQWPDGSGQSAHHAGGAPGPTL